MLGPPRNVGPRAVVYAPAQAQTWTPYYGNRVREGARPNNQSPEGSTVAVHTTSQQGPVSRAQRTRSTSPGDMPVSRANGALSPPVPGIPLKASATSNVLPQGASAIQLGMPPMGAMPLGHLHGLGSGTPGFPARGSFGCRGNVPARASFGPDCIRRSRTWLGSDWLPGSASGRSESSTAGQKVRGASPRPLSPSPPTSPAAPLSRVQRQAETLTARERVLSPVPSGGSHRAVSPQAPQQRTLSPGPPSSAALQRAYFPLRGAVSPGRFPGSASPPTAARSASGPATWSCAPSAPPFGDPSGLKIPRSLPIDPRSGNSTPEVPLRFGNGVGSQADSKSVSSAQTGCNASNGHNSNWSSASQAPRGAGTLRGTQSLATLRTTGYPYPFDAGLRGTVAYSSIPHASEPQLQNLPMQASAAEQRSRVGAFSPSRSQDSTTTTYVVPPSNDISGETLVETLQDCFQWFSSALQQLDAETPNLQLLFEAADEDCDGLLQLSGLTELLASVRITYGAPAEFDEEASCSLLRRFGMYTDEDVLEFAEFLEMYAQLLRALRDRYAPMEWLRRVRMVRRNDRRLKDMYEDFEFLRKGAFGKAHKCTSRDSRIERVCKQIRKDSMRAPMDQIRSDTEVLKSLEHPNILRVVQIIEDFNNVYIISEPIRGGELMDFVQDCYMRSECLSEAWVADVMQQLLGVLEYCHSQKPRGILHGDLKPECIVLTGSSVAESPHIVVTDLGLSELFDPCELADKDFTPNNSLGILLDPRSCRSSGSSSATHSRSPGGGSPEFLAPEVWQGNFGPKCDIWSAGCILYLLLAGRFPFGRWRPVGDFARAVASEDCDWQAFRHISTSALSFCRRMLTKEDASRPSAAECLRHPWFSAANGDDRAPKELRLESLSQLIQFQAQSKFQQVLMNMVSSELNVTNLRKVSSVFARLDSQCCGVLGREELSMCLRELGVSQQNADQVVQALDVESSGLVSYGPFIAGCIDLIEDKLDHMLWKIFTMVGEDHSGEISVVELEHFLRKACGDDPCLDSGAGNIVGGLGDVERYLRSTLDSGLSAHEIIAQIAGDSQVVKFGALKAFVLNSTSSKEVESAPRGERSSSSASHKRVRTDAGFSQPEVEQVAPVEQVVSDLGTSLSTPCSTVRMESCASTLSTPTPQSLVRLGSSDGAPPVVFMAHDVEGSRPDPLPTQSTLVPTIGLNQLT